MEQTWILWHALIGLGTGLLFIPVGPPFWLMITFLVTSLAVIIGVRLCGRLFVAVGLLALSIPLALRAIIIWRADSLGTGNKAVATFVWSMLAIGAALEGYSVKNRGIA